MRFVEFWLGTIKKSSKREEKTAPIPSATKWKLSKFLEFGDPEGESAKRLTNTLAQLGFEETP